MMDVDDGVNAYAYVYLTELLNGGKRICTIGGSVNIQDAESIV